MPSKDQAAGQPEHGDFFYFGDLWAEGLLASLTYINGPSGFTVEIR